MTENNENNDRLKYMFYNENHISEFENRTLMEGIHSYLQETGMGGVAKMLKAQFFDEKKQTLYPQTKLNLLKRWKSVLEYDREINYLKKTLDGLENGIESKTNIPFEKTLTYFKILRFGHSLPITSFAVHPSKPTVLTGSEDKSILVWDTDLELVVRKLQDHTSTVSALAFQRGGERFASANDQTFEVYIWEYHTFLRLRKIQIRDHTNTVTRICFGKRFCVTGGMDGTVRTWDIKNSWEMNLSFEGEKVQGLDLSHSENEIVLGDVEGNVFSVSTKQNETNEKKSLYKHPGSLKFVRISKSSSSHEEEEEEEEGESDDNDQLVISGADESDLIAISSLSEGKNIREVTTKCSSRPGVGCFLSGGEYFVVFFRDLKYCVFRVSNGELVKEMKIETTVGTSEPVGCFLKKDRLYYCDENCVRVYSV